MGAARRYMPTLFTELHSCSTGSLTGYTQDNRVWMAPLDMAEKLEAAFDLADVGLVLWIETHLVFN